MYSRRSIMRRVAYLLLIVCLFQASKAALIGEMDAFRLNLLFIMTAVHTAGFAVCILLFKRNRFDIGKWLLQFFFIAFVTSTGLLWQLDGILQYFCLLAIFITGFMFNEREDKAFFIFCGIYGALFLFFQYLTLYSTQALSFSLFSLGNSIILLGSTILCAYLVRRMTLSNWRKAQNLQHAKSNVVYKVFPERVSGKLLSLRSKRKSSAQDLMYKAPMLVAFLDIGNLSSLQRIEGEQSTDVLRQDIFRAFDSILQDSPCLRIKHDSEQYVFVCELKDKKHEAGVCRSLSMLREMYKSFNSLAGHTPLTLRGGVASGEGSAGMVNLSRPCFDVWGQPMVLASRLQKSAQAMMVHCDKHSFELAQERFYFLPPAVWNFKGLGQTLTYQTDLL